MKCYLEIIEDHFLRESGAQRNPDIDYLW